MSDCCSPSGCSAPTPAAGQPVVLPGLPDRRNRAERRRDARQSKR